MINGMSNVGKVPELRNRLGITLLFLVIYRIGVFVPIPGVDTVQLGKMLEQQAGNLFGMFDMFTGGALKNFSIFALGIMPYISASIIIQLMTVVVPYLEKLSKEGEMGRKKITQYTRYGTVLLSLFQGYLISSFLENASGVSSDTMIVLNGGLGFKLFTMLTLTAGTAFIMWLGEQITERGIGNGISLIIFAGIIARFPAGIGTTLEWVRVGKMNVFMLIFIVLIMVAVVAAIIVMETGHRKVKVEYAKRLVGRKMYGGQSTYIPLKLNTAGVIPPIFASSLLMFPATIAQFLPESTFLEGLKSQMSPDKVLYNVAFVLMIIFFCYFYTALTFNPMDIADNMKKSGGSIPGIRPGAKTSDYIKRILNRITLVGSLYISAVCVLPTILMYQFDVPFYFGGTGLLIVIGVAIDTIQQFESHLTFRNYDGFMKKSRLRGRK